MSDLGNKTVCVIDHGFFLPLARRLAKGFGRVLYHRPWEKAYPKLTDGVIGDGFGEIECVQDFWEHKSDIDCFVFPDIYHRGLQAELRSQGYPVWGAGEGMRLETNRQFFLNKLEELGLDVAPFEEVIGINALRHYLRGREDIFIKVSKWRGSWETCHWRSWEQDAHRLDGWAVKFGGVRERVRFLCFDKIETKLEIGADTYNVNGEWPSLMLHGVEAKDEAYFAAVTERSAMPKELTQIMEAFSPFLAASGYSSAWSMEVRVAAEGNFFIDATTRGGLPSTASQLLLWDNYPEIIWAGAHGQLVEPIASAKFSAECMVRVKGEVGAWETLVMPTELKDNLLVYDCCEVDGQVWFPADGQTRIEEVGWLCATGDTPTEVAERMNELADALPDGAEAAVEALAGVIREIEAEEEKSIQFTSQPMPDPSVVLEES